MTAPQLDLAALVQEIDHGERPKMTLGTLTPRDPKHVPDFTPCAPKRPRTNVEIIRDAIAVSAWTETDYYSTVKDTLFPLLDLVREQCPELWAEATQ